MRFHDGFVMAVRMYQHLAWKLGQVQIAGIFFEERAESVGVLGEFARMRIVGEEAVHLIAQHGSAAGLENYHWSARCDLLPKLFQDVAEIFFRLVEHAEVIEGSAATEVRSWNVHVEAERFQCLCRCASDLGMKVVVECVGPEDHSFSDAVLWFTREEPRFESLRRKLRDPALRRNSGGELCDMRKARRLRYKVHHPRPDGSEARPFVYQAECICVARTQAALPIMREELGLIGCNVNVDRAVALAAFAC